VSAATAKSSGSFRGIRYEPRRGSDSDWLYLADEPSPELTPDGKPSIGVIDLGDEAMLQLGVRLDPPAERVEALRAELQRLHPELGATGVRLAPLASTVGNVSLLVGDGSGTWTELDTSKSSGYPPYSTVFNLRLDAEERAAVAAAINGRREFLAVRYEATLATGEAVRLTTDVASWFDAPPATEHVLIPGSGAGESSPGTEETHTNRTSEETRC
jgi:hypothetical protein